MKKYLLIAIAAIICASCSDFLNESDPNSITSGNFYESEADITNVLNSAYASLKGNYYFVNSYHFTDVHSNLTVCTDPGARGGAYFQFYNFTLNEENEFLLNRYQTIYKSIGYADKLIYHLDDVTYADPSTRNSYEAQARFIRALGFYTLVAEWGAVPVFDKALTSMQEIKDANRRTSKADVYDQIYKDLQYVIDSPLSDLTPAADCGRVNKVAAYALYGKAALQQATDVEFASQRKSILAKAESMLLEAWNKKTFNELKDIPFSSVWDLSTQKGCKENIFQINFVAKNADLGSDFAYVYGPMSEANITSKHLCSSASMTTPEFYATYDQNDARRAFLRKTTYSGIEYYHSMKYKDLDCGSDGYGGNNWIVLRYADVALMLAEAYYWDGNETEAKKWLKAVRDRAGVVVSADAASSETGTGLRDAIYTERMKEFIHEGHSWHDYLRMYNADATLMVPVFQAKNPNFTLKDLLFPIPYSERILNPEGLPQNPGYLGD